jgi:hypothetical protein
MIPQHYCSRETFYQRLTNSVLNYFNIKNLFVERFTHRENHFEYQLNKKL